MISSYLIIAFRNLRRYPIYSFINITGLAIGLTASILILIWVSNEWSYDKFHPAYKRITQAKFFGAFGDHQGCWNELSYPTYQALKNKHADIETAAITDQGGDHLLSYSDKKIHKNGRFVSAEFLQIFDFQLLYGDVNAGFRADALFLTESSAKALFGNANPINQLVRIDNQLDVQVVGVLKDVPHNSSIQFDYLLSFEAYSKLHPWVNAQECMDDWRCDAFFIYAELQDGAVLQDVNKQIRNLLENTDDRFLSKELFLYPMERWNMHNAFENGKEASVDWSDYVTGFALLAVGILIVACINFMNLSTARSQRRAREVGIRKISGSLKRDIVIQFLGESMLISTASIVLALLFVYILLPVYSFMVGKPLAFPYGSVQFWLGCLLVLIITGLLSGTYPAFYLSSFSPAKILKSQLNIFHDSVLPRSILVIFQFGFSILLIVGTAVVYQQISFVMSRQLGFEKERLITIPNNEEVQRNFKVIKEALMTTGVVSSVTKSSSPITDVFDINFIESSGSSTPLPISDIEADYDYLQTMGVKLIEGQDFSRTKGADSSAVIVNQRTVDLLGLENPIGAKVTVAGAPAQIIGITEDVVMQSPFEEVKPMYLLLRTDWSDRDLQFMSIRMEQGDVHAQLEIIGSVFKKYSPSYPFNYSFVDQEFDRKFNSITLIQKLVSTFAFLSLIIACLGLFGLAAFTAERRTKEFGVRKVLGATRSSLVILVSRYFIKLMIWAIVLMVPIVWWGEKQFLAYYQYHTEFNWLIVPVSTLILLITTLGIVGTQTLRAASINPSQTLKCE